MKVAEPIIEGPAFTIQYSDYNCSYSRDVYWNDLRKGEVGKIFRVEDTSNTCGRDVYDEEAKIVYKDDDGVAVVFTLHRTADTPESEDLGKSVKLCWFHFGGTN